MIETRITRLFGIRHPIVQGGMRHISRADLAAAVSNGGGLGLIAVHSFSGPDALLAEIDKARALTDRPFGVNLTIIQNMRGASPDDYVAAILESGVRIVETSGANPGKYIPRLKAAGITVVHKCTSVRFARKAEELGADAVTVVGFEGAGHLGPDDVPALVLVPRILETVSIPVIAAGGVARGTQVAAMLALGAEGVAMGSRFLLTQEAHMHEAVKERALAVDERGTRVILRSIGDPTRAIANQMADRVLKMEAEGGHLHEELVSTGGGTAWIDASERGDAEGAAYAIGLSAALIDHLEPAAEVVARVAAEAEDTIRGRLAGLVRPDPD
ncbi:NAD(P)H-dependent flavin oxidoreductase [Tropicimonas isoalkanivorans]|uniref:2-nitropropane dioxygenase n=1 Tax=Tropicimonas isoalkanivorans TaxID=441112 RepID=A0A1I1HYB2_9RHOB|nr:nitronate monooxygenase [Tropicimonas isoalkanivorans]SFC29067.1 2-nitropropane dioxygenase precursor [Tropicimonas isoalkanivorans]